MYKTVNFPFIIIIIITFPNELTLSKPAAIPIGFSKVKSRNLVLYNNKKDNFHVFQSQHKQSACWMWKKKEYDLQGVLNRLLFVLEWDYIWKQGQPHDD